jgi:hypothetical protein
MSKRLFFLVFAVAISCGSCFAQSFTVAYDTVILNSGGPYNAPNNVTNTTANDLTVVWKVTETNFPADWMELTGICDVQSCWSNTDILPGREHDALYGPGEGDFHLQGDLSFVSESGPYYIRVQLMNKDIPADVAVQTYVIGQVSAGVAEAARKSVEDIISVYPNPATSSLNVVYNGVAGVTNIGIYSIIGRQMKMYSTTESSASLDVEQLPAGLYFLKLLDAQGYVLAAQRFAKQ